MAEKILIKDLKPILDQHEIDIKVLKKTREDFKDHLKKHEDVYDPKLKNYGDILFGEKGDNGMAFSMKNIELTLKQIQEKQNIKDDSNKWMLRLVVGTLVTAVLNLILK